MEETGPKYMIAIAFLRPNSEIYILPTVMVSCAMWHCQKWKGLTLFTNASLSPRQTDNFNVQFGTTSLLLDQMSYKPD